MTKVGDLVEFAYGKALKASDRSGEGVPVVGSGGVVGQHKRALTIGPTIVIGRKGTIGSVTWIDGPAWPIDTAYFVKHRREGLDPRWTYWMLRSLRMETMNKSAAVPGLNRDDVYRLDVDLPPLDEQRRVAAILDHADALRTKRRVVMGRYEDLVQATFQDAFGSATWEGSLGEMAQVQTGPFGSLLHKEDYVAGGVPVINPSHIRNGMIVPSEEFTVTDNKAATLSRYRLRAGDVVLGRRGEMGRAGIVYPAHEGALCGTGSLILRPTGCTSVFLHALVTSRPMKNYLEQESLGATLPNLNASIVKSAPAPCVGVEPQEMFARQIAAIGRLLLRSRQVLDADHELFASLQSRAFRGEL